MQNRGFHIRRKGSVEGILQPEPATLLNLEVFYHHLHHYSFRLFLRDAVANRKGFTADQLSRYCSPRVVKKYLRLLLNLNIILLKRYQTYRLSNLNVHTFGETLEWYIAQVFLREFASPALWGIELQNTTPGGDFDVLAEIDHHLVYVEVKSSPPKGIHLANVETFLQRVEVLASDLALFLVDTHLRMENKINVLFEQANKKSIKNGESVKKIIRGVFQVRKHVYVLNAKPNIINNIRICVRHYFQNID